MLDVHSIHEKHILHTTYGLTYKTDSTVSKRVAYGIFLDPVGYLIYTPLKNENPSHPCADGIWPPFLALLSRKASFSSLGSWFIRSHAIIWLPHTWASYAICIQPRDVAYPLVFLFESAYVASQGLWLLTANKALVSSIPRRSSDPVNSLWSNPCPFVGSIGDLSSSHMTQTTYRNLTVSHLHGLYICTADI